MLNVIEPIVSEQPPVSDQAAETQQQPSQTAIIQLLKNKEALVALQEDNEKLAAGWGVIVTATATSYFLVPLIAPGATGAAWIISTWTHWRATKVIRLIRVIKLLLKKFESEGIEVYPRIPVEGMNPIDLFIRFPQKTHLFVAIRSKGDTEIAYNEGTEILSVKRKNTKLLSKWEPNPLVELADQERWLAKNRSLIGLSSKEASKTPTAKVLVLCSPTKVEQHRDELYSEVGSMRTLVLRRKGSAFVIQEEELINFIEAWLAKYTNRNSTV
jgi:hypothetical protein